MNHAANLTPEWERIEILGACLAAARGGAALPPGYTARLEGVQQQVLDLRRSPPWSTLVEACQLDSMDQDVLACCVAPEAEPRLGWMYQDLQPGMAAHFPTPALIRELLVLDGDASRLLDSRLDSSSPLVSNGLIEPPSRETFVPLRPGVRARAELLEQSPGSWLNLPGAARLAAREHWDDLILPPLAHQYLKEFLLWVTHREQLENDWGARLDGGGPVALFAGASGTGKSLAARVVANALEYPLFRVDLGLLVSKYIGETEKNLNALFDAAKGQQLVLLFDEADSLFGKRGEIREARDRYANMEVSHLLTRIEDHRGPCILTSNFRQNLDPAFARRMQMVIEFPRPNAAAREQMWRRHIPAKAPLDKNLDIDSLGREIRLTGGQIRNAALHAAFLAAGESACLGQAHIARAVWVEFAKSGTTMISERLGAFARSLPVEMTDAGN